jgi:hypothetical protein
MVWQGAVVGSVRFAHLQIGPNHPDRSRFPTHLSDGPCMMDSVHRKAKAAAQTVSWEFSAARAGRHGIRLAREAFNGLEERKSECYRAVWWRKCGQSFTGLPGLPHVSRIGRSKANERTLNWHRSRGHWAIRSAYAFSGF